MSLHLLYFLAGMGCMATMFVCFQFWIVQFLQNGQLRAARAKRKRQRDMIPFHPRRAEALSAWEDVQRKLCDRSRHSRFSHFRGEDGKPAAARGPRCYSYSICGAIILAVWPEDVPDSEDSQMDRAWRSELQDVMLGVVFCLMPEGYESVDDFSNYAPWPVIENLLRNGQELLREPEGV